MRHHYFFKSQHKWLHARKHAFVAQAISSLITPSSLSMSTLAHTTTLAVHGGMLIS